MKVEKRTKATEGILIMCVGVVCLCINDAIAKTLTDGYSPLQILFMRNAIALPFVIALVLKLGGPQALRSYRPMAHLLRGILWLSAATLFFTGLSYLGLAEATTLIFAAPVFVTALTALVLKEKVGLARWSFVLLGFLGVLIVVRPGTATFQMASLFPLATAFLYALLMISSRWVDPRESVWTLMLYLSGFGALLSALLQPFVWQPIQTEDIWLFLGIALLGTLGVTLITQAFRFAPAAVVAPFDYTALIWATLLGWLLWDEIPDGVTYIGASIIVLSGILIVLRERKLALKEEQESPASAELQDDPQSS
ncbi:Permease of the drug/metabolite transporter (DMT) superfamily [Cohaesibacter sp. ES.047]|uniref:DMT family transporter n=1 Tax=Cohaesibacter sp. ES.047 TaxID=1798205 RepID=UPI000BC060FC|nr:DMT family transporter [Cohaesibacter sp. ES.047]SNY90720.1 Permease of the drug/metabolite transporter (DMT) superfamily [Cohaesibacter sp. ES.047]